MPGGTTTAIAHIETILRRAVATGFNPKKMTDMLTLFSGAVRFESVHPLQVGVVRRKIRDAAPPGTCRSKAS